MRRTSKEEIIELLGEQRQLLGIETLKAAEAVGFALYREAAVLLTVVASCARVNGTSEYPFAREQAICCGLIMRMSKFMISVLHLAADQSGGEVILALNRCILESAINCEYLLWMDDSDLYREFVQSSLAPERELYDQVKANVSNRGGQTLPIEDRILSSILRTCECSGITIANVQTKYPQWGINLRERMRKLGKEALYLHIQKVGSHAVHGSGST